MLKSADLFSPGHTIAERLICGKVYPWQVLSDISSFIVETGRQLPEDKFNIIGENVWAAKDAVIFPSVYIKGPCIICSGAEVRHSAFIRGSVIIGAGAVVGNSTELKNSILFDGVQAPHFNYVGDSILGYKSHMGAGSITSNLKSDKTLVTVKAEDGTVETGVKKVGAFLGDYVEVGCNSVLNPGTVIGKGSMIYPLSCVRGVVPANSIYKTGGVICPKKQ